MFQLFVFFFFFVVFLAVFIFLINISVAFSALSFLCSETSPEKLLSSFQIIGANAMTAPLLMTAGITDFSALEFTNGCLLASLASNPRQIFIKHKSFFDIIANKWR